MVHVKCMHLLRSKYGIKELDVEASTVQDVLNALKKIYPTLDEQDFYQAVLFVNKQKISHNKRFNTPLTSGDEVVFTNFVGGG